MRLTFLVFLYFGYSFSFGGTEGVLKVSQDGQNFVYTKSEVERDFPLKKASEQHIGWPHIEIGELMSFSRILVFKNWAIGQIFHQELRIALAQGQDVEITLVVIFLLSVLSYE